MSSAATQYKSKCEKTTLSPKTMTKRKQKLEKEGKVHTENLENLKYKSRAGGLVLKERLQADKESCDVDNIILEEQARLSVFDRFMFLLDTDDKAKEEDNVSESRCSDDENETDMASSVKCLSSLPNINSEEEQEELTMRLSAFDPFFFLLDNDSEGNDSSKSKTTETANPPPKEIYLRSYQIVKSNDHTSNDNINSIK